MFSSSSSAKNSGGLTHVEYGHRYYPRWVQVVCPFCSKPASLLHTEAKGEFFADLEYSKRTYQFNCNYCLKRKFIDWDDIKDWQLLNKISVRNEEIWAWNTNHLDYLIGVFSGNENKLHDWAFFRTYINKKWFTKTRHPADINKLKQLLETNRIV
jgi:hypothetical protein